MNFFFSLGSLGIGRVRGEFSFGGTNWRVCMPDDACILLSAILTRIVRLVDPAHRDESELLRRRAARRLVEILI